MQESILESMSLFNKIRTAFLELSFSPDELIELFNKKYEHTDTLIPILDNNGEPAVSKSGERIMKNYSEVDDHDKVMHSMALIHKFKNNQVEYVGQLSREKELLEMAEAKGSNLKKLIESSL
jgi:hypothetical protein